MGLLLLLCVSCADVTEVRVRLQADDSVAAAAVELRVSVRGGDDEVTERVVRIGEDGSFPFEVPVVPRGGDSSRTFELFAELVGEGGASLGTQRVLANFADGEQRIIERTFTEQCGPVRCAAGRTCDGEGACAGACDLAEGGGVPLGCSEDACEELGLISEHFEIEGMDIEDVWEECPDGETSEPDENNELEACLGSLDSRDVSVTDARDAGIPAPPCRPRVLRLVSGRTTRGTYFALPSANEPRWMRAMVYSPETNEQVLMGARPNSQALMRWSNGYNVIDPDPIVDLRWKVASTSSRWRTNTPELIQEGSGELPWIPNGEWTCVEFSFNAETRLAGVGINGGRMRENESEIADLFDSDVVYATVGLLMGGIPMTLYVDDVVVSNERIPCP